ncbi:MAG: pitrilysin family protein [Candidatus Woesearchaeota archaeon]|jgi:predicted Zn-dependent peptidase|nr:pitrilysin family protein [Candidatus Woesearchaeota archaeon]MDP6265226.1 pitrilysin family protein [Candidatus Woesearchaeota archaeon]MDP7322876.1 pitrilysin family protein [Candidatus Woesearchaeota archaeon]MDP7476589.1 pitrilysin family protein [Candidatus Woesearchaeota archaeon]HJO01761.1 pitrilysin family protein [Candidatus Woesearchaeota archaeon]|tara:strand:+ start:645 stop:1853 length:1209 start_codon:yes stop_codon:yes gene_type:complete
MEKYRLKNGTTIIFEKNSSKSVAVEVIFKVGSNDESKEISGISHFLEHMLFEGTKKRKNSRKIASEIEKYGAEFNAYTSNDRTAFFIKIINKRFEKALDILSDMVANPLFNKKTIEKEKQVIFKEINLVTDDSRQHQWILFQKTLFEKHPTKNPTYGTIEAIKSLDRKIIDSYYNKHYVPNNMVISIVGNVNHVKEKIEKYFDNLKPKKLALRKNIKEPLQKRKKKFVEKRKTVSSYMILGYKSVSRIHKDSYVLDVISAILGKGQSGWIFDEIRNKRGLAYQVGVLNENEGDYGYFAVFAGLDKKNIEKTKGIILQQFRKLNNVRKNDVEEAKNYIEGNHTISMEDNFQKADNIAFWETIKNASLADNYIKNIKRVEINDVKRAARKYLNKNYTLVVIEQK